MIGIVYFDEEKNDAVFLPIHMIRYMIPWAVDEASPTHGADFSIPGITLAFDGRRAVELQSGQYSVVEHASGILPGVNRVRRSVESRRRRAER